MAKIIKKNKKTNMLVKVKLSFKEAINERHLDYIAEKKIGGLLKVHSKKRKTIIYTGPNGIELNKGIKNLGTKFDFFFIIEQIVDLVQRLNKNSVSTENIIWDIYHIYINDITKELSFICLPMEKEKKEAKLMDLLEQVIYSFIPENSLNPDFVTKFVYYIRSLSGFDALAIEKYIAIEQPDVVDLVKCKNGIKSGDNSFSIDFSGDDETSLLAPDDEGTMLLNDEDEGTVLLSETEIGFVTAKLIRKSTNETIMLNKPVFRIGKDARTSDYVISNNERISRKHANIIMYQECHKLSDLGSTNGTYINGVRIVPGEEKILSSGDIVLFADEEFQYIR